jgi:Prokaryotic N-terminal methylation motif
MRDTSGRSTRGFSVIEVLIATAIFFIIAIGVLPLFTHAMANNVAGKESTEVTNFAKSRVEEMLQLPFNDERLTIPAGANVLEIVEHWDNATDAWLPGPAVDGSPRVRTTRVRQFGVNDLLDGFLDTPLSGSFPAEQVHLKEIEVEVRGTRDSGPFGGAKRTNVRMLRAI